MRFGAAGPAAASARRKALSFWRSFSRRFRFSALPKHHSRLPGEGDRLPVRRLDSRHREGDPEPKPLETCSVGGSVVLEEPSRASFLEQHKLPAVLLEKLRKLRVERGLLLLQGHGGSLQAVPQYSTGRCSQAPHRLTATVPLELNSSGAPSPTRTGGLRFRKPSLYPPELWGRTPRC